MGRNRCSDERQAQIYEVIKSFLMEKGYPPSVREIGKIVGLKSSSTVHGYLAKLEEAGKIVRDPTKPRAIDLVDDPAWKDTTTIPLVYRGEDSFEDEDNIITEIAMPNNWLPVREHLFSMHVDNDDLASCGIEEDDFIIIKQQRLAKDKDVMLVIPEGETKAVLRLCSKEKGGGLLINDLGASDLLRKAKVIGKVISVYHQF